jgi:hypothetical protein
VDLVISDLQLPTQDGGNFSDMKETLSEMKEVKLLLFKVELITRTETSSLKTKMERLTNNGRSSMLTSMRRSQLRDNSTRSSDFMLREISTSSPNCQITDTLI